MIKIAICDDEEVMCRRLREMVSELLTRWKEPFSVTCYTGSLALLVSPLDFDLIFLDIQMPGLDGMTLAEKIRQKGFHGALIFVTVLKDWMAGAFAVEASDYLCKPVEPARLEAALQRTLKRLHDRKERCLFIRTANWCRSVRIRDIYYCEVIDRKIYVHTGSEVIDYYGKMKELEKQIGTEMIRCHRSYLLNPDHLLEYRDGLVTMENGETLPVSKNFRKVLMERMMEYMDQEEG